MDSTYQRPQCSCCQGAHQHPAILQNLLSKQSSCPSSNMDTPPTLYKEQYVPRARYSSPMAREGSTGVPSPYSSSGSPSPPSPESSPGPLGGVVADRDFISPRISYPTHPQHANSTQSKLYHFLTGQRHLVAQSQAMPRISPGATTSSQNWLEPGQHYPYPQQQQQQQHPHRRPTHHQHHHHHIQQQRPLQNSHSRPTATVVPSIPVLSPKVEDTYPPKPPVLTISTPPSTDTSYRLQYAIEPVSPPLPSPRKRSREESRGMQMEPMDLSVKKPRMGGEEPDEETPAPTNSSILMNILCGQKRSQLYARESPSPATGGCAGVSAKCIPSDIPSENKAAFNSSYTATTSNSRVVLAKKNLFPVRARVSDWLVKMLQFVRSLPEFDRLPHNDQVTLLLNSWARLLLVYMAETNFHFAVTPAHAHTDTSGGEEILSQDVPTMKSVEVVQGFIKKCQGMNMDEAEIDFLKKSAIFQSGAGGLESQDYVDQVNANFRQSLQDHIQNTRGNEKLRYSQLLMCLPALYGINSSMIRNLFCKHLEGSNDVELLLKEGLRAL